MKVTYELDSADLKAAIEAWMSARRTPVNDADTFTIDSGGVVTITTTNVPESTASPVLAPIKPVSQAPIVSQPATSAPVVSQIPPILATSGVAVVAPQPGHLVQVDPPLSVTGQATEFGYKDPTDNGLGFFYDPATGKPYETNNDVLRGVSLSREVLLSTFLKIDSWKTEGIADVWSRNGSMLRQWVDSNKPLVTIDSGGKSASDLPIVDAGPAAGTDNAIDCTGKIAMELGPAGADPTQFKQLATYMILVAGAPIPIRGWSWTAGKVG